MTRMYWSASLICLDATRCYQTSWFALVFWFFLLSFISRDKTTRILVYYAINSGTKKRGHKHHVSTLRWHYFLTFTAKLGPDSWSVWSYGVNWRKASDFGASTNDKQQYFQIFFSLAGQTQLALRSVKQTKTLQHWNVTWQQVWV